MDWRLNSWPLCVRCFWDEVWIRDKLKKFELNVAHWWTSWISRLSDRDRFAERETLLMRRLSERYRFKFLG
jgi:hypothetical protein